MKPGNPIQITIIMIVIILLTAASGYTQESIPIGKAVAVRGEIIAVNADSNPRELMINAPVFLNDTIKTGQGRIQLMFNDNTLMTLGSNTELKLTKYSWKPEDKDSAMETEVEEGSFRIVGGAITRIAPDNFKTRTPSGTIGIRGSMYAGIVKDQSLSVIFQGGKGIHIINDMGFVTITEPGFGTTIKSPAQAPEEPKKMTQEELQVFESMLAENRDNQPQDDKTSQSEQTDPQSGSGNGTGDAESDKASESTALSSIKDVMGEIADTTVASSQLSHNTGITSTGPDQEIKNLLLSLGYSGSLSQSSSVPLTGIWVYTGKLKNMLTSETPDNIKFVVNWDNHRIVGFEEISDPSKKIDNGFGFGTVDLSGTINDFRVLGSDSFDSWTIRALTGKGTFGHFYGSDQSGLGLSMEGYDINLRNSADQLFWKDISAAVINSRHTDIHSGTETWNGFFTGIAENMASPDVNRRAFLNTDARDFTMDINKDNGTLTGLLSGEDFMDAGNCIADLSIGGGTGESFFIADKMLGASLSGNTVISINGNSGGLKPHGNFMLTYGSSPLSTYTTWGYWEAAYSEPGTGNDYHIHIPGSLWISGNPTPAAAVSGLISSSFTGTYNGKAEGVMFNASSQMNRMTNGTTNLTINFASDAPAPVSGKISFNEIVLPISNIESSYVSKTGFHAVISDATSSKINGGFFGPNAEAAAGNFSAVMPDGMAYHGIFAGNR